MTLFQALALAFVQGMTEFLPVSSSGHLAFFGRIFGMKAPDINFDIVLHMATLLAVLIYYRKQLIGLTVSLFSRRKGEGFAENPLRFLFFVILTSIPTGIIGLALNKRMEKLHENLIFVGVCFFITAVMLFITHLKQRKGITGTALLNAGWWVPALIGVAQGIAVLPGVSRSGFTIGAALLLGISATDSADYGFLVSIPAILGAFLLKLGGISAMGLSLNYALGFILAFAVGLASIRLVVVFVEKARLHYFAAYMVILSVLTLILGFAG
ncbi:MAG: undecaprenyl-diphosphate phosphatase [Acidobacteria bacterium]|nr:undecaprenyl-diphosphate phosphatase [Acidobacteriota bacterium]